MGAWEIFLGLSGPETPEGPAETCEAQDTRSPVGKRRRVRGPAGPPRGTLPHTPRPHRRRADANGALFALRSETVQLFLLCGRGSVREPLNTLPELLFLKGGSALRKTRTGIL